MAERKDKTRRHTSRNEVSMYVYALACKGFLQDSHLRMIHISFRNSLVLKLVRPSRPFLEHDDDDTVLLPLGPNVSRYVLSCMYAKPMHR